MYCYTEFKIRYLNNLKLFSVGIKELIEPIVLWKKADGFLFFLKALSSETDLLVTLTDFTVKNAKFGREICILKIDLAETKCGVRLITIICITYAQRDF